MSKKCPLKNGFSEFSKKLQDFVFDFRTENAAPLKRQLVPRFFSAAKKDYFA
jgi:hypothetical protein